MIKRCKILIFEILKWHDHTKVLYISQSNKKNSHKCKNIIVIIMIIIWLEILWKLIFFIVIEYYKPIISSI